MFRNPLSEAESGAVALPGASLAALRIALVFLYTGRLEAGPPAPHGGGGGGAHGAGGSGDGGHGDGGHGGHGGGGGGHGHGGGGGGGGGAAIGDLLGALALFRMFLLPAGAELCLEAVRRRLSPATATGVLIWADQNADEALRACALDFVLKRFSEIRAAHPACLELLASAPGLMLEVMKGLSVR